MCKAPIGRCERLFRVPNPQINRSLQSTVLSFDMYAIIRVGSTLSAAPSTNYRKMQNEANSRNRTPVPRPAETGYRLCDIEASGPQKVSGDGRDLPRSVRELAAVLY